MAGESIKIILDIEGKAERTVDESRVRANSIIASAREQKKLLEKGSLEQARADKEEALSLARNKAQDEIGKLGEETALKLRALDEASRSRAEKAKALIISKMMKKLCL